MKSSKRRFIPLIIGITICVISSLASVIIHHVFGIIINYTDSLPKGFYQLHPIKTEIKCDIIVALPVPEHVQSIIYGGRWLLKGSILLKPVAAIPGDRILIADEGLFINGEYFGPVFSFDNSGLPLLVLRTSYILKDNQVFLASPYPRSFDSRYFGLIDTTNIIAEAVPVLIF